MTGNIGAASFAGNGSALTSLNAGNLASGTLPNGRLAGTYGSALILNNAANIFSASTFCLSGTCRTTWPAGTVTGVTASAPLASSGGAAPNLSLGVVPIANGGTGVATVPSIAGQYLQSAAAGSWSVGTILSRISE